MTKFEEVYKAFLAVITDDEWACPQDYDIYEEDWKSIMFMALGYFKFPGVNLEDINMEEECFNETLGFRQINIIAAFMRAVWMGTMISTWENLRPLYHEQDFSPANLIDKLNVAKDSAYKEAKALESAFYRSPGFKSYPYRRFAGG